jgi:hypothetical protein
LPFHSRGIRWNLVAKLCWGQDDAILGNVTIRSLSRAAFKANSGEVDVRTCYLTTGAGPWHVETQQWSPSHGGWTRPSPKASSRQN